MRWPLPGTRAPWLKFSRAGQRCSPWRCCSCFPNGSGCAQPWSSSPPAGFAPPHRCGPMASWSGSRWRVARPCRQRPEWRPGSPCRCCSCSRSSLLPGRGCWPVHVGAVPWPIALPCRRRAPPAELGRRQRPMLILAPSSLPPLPRWRRPIRKICWRCSCSPPPPGLASCWRCSPSRQ